MPLFSAQRIHVSSPCKSILDQLGGFLLEERGLVSVKVRCCGLQVCFQICLNARNDCYTQLFNQDLFRGTLSCSNIILVLLMVILLMIIDI